MVWSLKRYIVTVLLAGLEVGEDTEVVGIEQRFRLRGVSGMMRGFWSRIRLQDVSRSIGRSLPCFSQCVSRSIY